MQKGNCLKLIVKGRKMINYIKAENMKQKRTFIICMIILAPVLCNGLAFVLMPGYFISATYNWWNTIILPVVVTLVSVLIHQKDQKILGYGAIDYLPIDKKKFWMAKIFVSMKYIVYANGIHLILSALLYRLIKNYSEINYNLKELLMETLIMLIGFLWQLPLCLLLLKKFANGITMLINIVAGIILSTFCSEGKIWTICPYTYGARGTMLVLGVRPNGLLTETPYGNNACEILICICLSTICGIALIIFTTRILSKVK